MSNGIGWRGVFTVRRSLHLAIVEKSWQDGAVVVLAGLRGTRPDGSVRNDLQGPLRAADERRGEEGGQSG